MSWTTAPIPNLNSNETGYTDGTHYIAVSYRKPADCPPSIFAVVATGRQVNSDGTDISPAVVLTFNQNGGLIRNYINNTTAVQSMKDSALSGLQNEFDGRFSADSVYAQL